MESWDRGILANLELRTPWGRAVYIVFFAILPWLRSTVLFPFCLRFHFRLENQHRNLQGRTANLPCQSAVVKLYRCVGTI